MIMYKKAQVPEIPKTEKFDHISVELLAVDYYALIA
jgi:hypothetical protein